MQNVYFLSFLFITVAVLPLWWDANLRPEYGKRPRFLLASIFTFVAAAIGSWVLDLLDPAASTFLRPGIAGLLLCILFLALYLLEYSVHHQRIHRNHLVDAYKQNSRPVFLLLAGAFVTAVVSVVLLSYMFANKDTYPQTLDDLISAVLVLTMALLILAAIFTISLYGMQSGVIRRKIYPFSTFIIFCITLVVFRFIKGPAGDILSLLTLLGVNFLYASRAFHEYFIYRMHHLSDMNRRQMEVDENRTRLINQVLVSDSRDDHLIIKHTIESFMEQLTHAIPSKTQSIKSMMVMQRTGAMLSVLSEDFIYNYCAPLVSSENMKRMSPEELKKHILAQTFDLDEIIGKAPGTCGDFAKEAMLKLMSTKEPVTISPLPPGLKNMYRLVTLYPVLNQDKLVGAVVIYKDGTDHILPVEDIIIRNMTGNLSIVFSIMAGKQVQEEKNRLSGEMDSAKNIQTSILPRVMEIPGYETCVSMVTASEVGGDLYDYFSLPEANFVNIGDVSGHGLPSGLMALIQMSAFQSALYCAQDLGKNLEAWQVYDIVNKTLVSINRNRIGSDKFMTGNMLKEKNGTFSHAGAHLTAIVYRRKRNVVDRIPGMMDRTAFLGISEFIQSKSSEGSFTLEAGDILMLYTDGLVEARNMDGSFFGLESVEEVLLRHAAEPLDAIKTQLMTKLEEFASSGDLKKHDGKFADDVSIVMLRRL